METQKKRNQNPTGNNRAESQYPLTAAMVVTYIAQSRKIEIPEGFFRMPPRNASIVEAFADSPTYFAMQLTRVCTVFEMNLLSIRRITASIADPTNKNNWQILTVSEECSSDQPYTLEEALDDAGLTTDDIGLMQHKLGMPIQLPDELAVQLVLDLGEPSLGELAPIP